MELPFIRKLRHGAALTEDDVAILAGFARSARASHARADFGIDSATTRSVPIVLDGWACRYRMLANGKRQIVFLFLPGDLCEPFGVPPRFLDHALSSLTPVRYALAPLTALRQALYASPRIEQALWWDMMLSTEIERERLVSLGRRSASERMGHLFCELHLRLDMIGLVEEDGFDLPVTQVDLGDLLGLSAVHVNRSLQELRKAGLISLTGRRLMIHDLESLCDLSYFEPDYLRGASASR